MQLPTDITPEQFDKAEPIVLAGLIEEFYTSGIAPLRPQDYRRVKPGEYQGEFRGKDGRSRFTFEIDSKGIFYKPITLGGTK